MTLNANSHRRKASLLLAFRIGGMSAMKGMIRLSNKPYRPPYSFVGTLKKHFPSLVKHVSDLDSYRDFIAESAPPVTDRRKVFHVEDIGEPTTACFLTATAMDPTGWFDPHAFTTCWHY